MYQASQTLTGIADVNTGLKFLDKDTVEPYNSTKSRYEGTSKSRRRRQGAEPRCRSVARRSPHPTRSLPRHQLLVRGSSRPRVGRRCGRFLTLREGSIVVVTVLAVVYFASSNDQFFTARELRRRCCRTSRRSRSSRRAR